jgi:NAD(P)-dependent dehydrogenase (short-subunit alcohol dehydrogenase family)
MPEGRDAAVKKRKNAQTLEAESVKMVAPNRQVTESPDQQMQLLGALALGLTAGAAAAVAWRRGSSYDFRDRIAVITGGSRGLGLEMARVLAREGAHLVLLARDEEELERAEDELCRRFNVHIVTIACDVTKREEVNCAIEEAVGMFGRLDILINNAGVIQFGPFEHMTIQDFDEALAVHLYGPLYATLAALPHLQAAGEGRIVNISSIGGRIAVPHLAPYCASKFALTGLSGGLRIGLRKYGIRVTTVCPGLMRTGSPPNAFFKGNHRAEYTWFALGASTPGLTMSAKRAARKIVEACRRGTPRITLTLAAKAAASLDAVAPGMFDRFTALGERILPKSEPGHSPKRYTGWESQSSLAPSPLTVLSDRATVRNNELVAADRGRINP